MREEISDEGATKKTFNVVVPLHVPLLYSADITSLKTVPHAALYRRGGMRLT
jgi:hypothetical protein